jgi:hypothetical protein
MFAVLTASAPAAQAAASSPSPIELLPAESEDRQTGLELVPATREPAAPSKDAGAEPVQERASVALLVNPIGLVLGAANLDVGIGVADSLSLNFAVAYIPLDDGSAYAGGMGVQIFPGGDLYGGFFIYPQAAYARASREGDSGASGYGFGGVFGYQWSFTRFSLRLGAGALYYSSSGDGAAAANELSGVSPLLDGSVGLVF